MRTMLAALAMMAIAFTWPAEAGTSRGGLNLSLADTARTAHRERPASSPILNGLPNFRSTGSVNLIGGLRLEADLTHQRTDNSHSDIARSRGFPALGRARNGRLESMGTGVSLVQGLESEGLLQPYLIGSLGATRLTESSLLGDQTVKLSHRLSFDFELGAGLAVRLGEGVKLAAGYRFISNIGTVAGFDSLDTEAQKRDTSSHIFGISVLVPFGEVD